MTTEMTVYKAGENMVELSPDIIRKYLVSGEGKITDQEMMMFIKLCEYQKLNPFLREVYLIKYGSSPATMVTGKETFLKRAYRHDKYRGHQTGISDDGKVAWAEVSVQDYKVPIRCEVDYDEYVGRKKDGTVNSMWKSKPRTMLKKVALVQALREAFPETFGGMYSQEEINTVDAELLPDKELKPEEQEALFITEAQVTELQKLSGERVMNAPRFLKHFEVKALSEIPSSRFDEAIQIIKTKPEREVATPEERIPGDDDGEWMDDNEPTQEELKT